MPDNASISIVALIEKVLTIVPSTMTAKKVGLSFCGEDRKVRSEVASASRATLLFILKRPMQLTRLEKALGKE